MIHLAIDPGKKTGFAEYNTKNGDLSLQTLDFWSCFWLVLKYDPKTTVVHVEAPKTKRNFHKTGDITASNASSTYWLGHCLADGIEGRGFTVHRHHPKRGMVNLDAKQFAMITGYKGRSNQHTRDAALLAFKANK